jgi:hypothetical protein
MLAIGAEQFTWAVLNRPDAASRNRSIRFAAVFSAAHRLPYNSTCMNRYPQNKAYLGERA